MFSKPKELGGLGFGKTFLRNIALLGKWLWRFPRERSGLWHKVIASIYGTHPNGWDANMVVRWSHKCPWKAIAKVFQVFSPFVRLVVGNGERIHFWEDLWWEIDLLQRLMSSLSSMVFLSFFGKFKSMVFVIVRLVFSEIFFLGLVKSLKSYLVPSDQVFVEFKSPFKGNGESIDHLFLHCHVTIGLWHKLFNLARQDTLANRLPYFDMDGVQERIFEDKGRTEEMLWDLIMFYSSLWASCTTAFRGVPLKFLLLGVFSFVQFV
ncbi:hypothetical protein CK203_039948 [Vitis vinifera]|uniref:Uncharacterized protein n=1 Tax=Vitis vinifera TaxID=29760 RepID=A0A438I362_VITVI|nr:hypothetical protein CK203_039948 [Vitis vinifera]